MKRSLAALFVLLALAGSVHAFGLGLGNRFGKLGSFGSGGGVTPPTFQGPGDIQPTGWTLFVGLQGFNASYRGRSLNVCNPSDVSCLDVNIVFGGGLDPAPLASLGCNNSTTICTIKTFYDQSGGTNCGSAACDFTQAAIASRAIFVTSGSTNCTSTAYPCAKFINGKYSTAAAVTVPEPYTILAVAQHCVSPGSCGGTFGTILADASANFGLYFKTTANVDLLFANADNLAAAGDNAWHVIQGITNTTTSSLNIDAIKTSFSLGSASPAFQLLGADPADALGGYLSIVGLNSNALSGATVTGLNNNQHSNWGLCCVAWGDSLTAGNEDGTGTTYPGVLGPLFSPARGVVNEGVGGDTSSQILTLFQANNWAWNSGTIIWSGRNDFSTPSTVETNIATMVGDLTTQKFIVMSIINEEGETLGSGNYNAIVALNSALASTYGTHFLDVRSMLIASFNPAIGPDVIDHNNDVPPFSLRAIDTRGTLTAGIDNVTCTIGLTQTLNTVANNVILNIEGELIYVLSITGSSISACTRGYGSTTAVAHNLGIAYAGTDPLHLGAAGYTLVAQFVRSKIQALGGF